MEIREVAGRTPEMETLFDSVEADLSATYGEDIALAHVAGMRRLAGTLPGFLAVEQQAALGLVLINQSNGLGRIALARAQREEPGVIAPLLERAVSELKTRGVREISADEEYAGQVIGPALARLGFRASERLNMVADQAPEGHPGWPLGFRITNWREDLFAQGARVLHSAFRKAPDARWDDMFRTAEGSAQTLRNMCDGKYGAIDGELSFLVSDHGKPCGILLATRRPASSGYLLSLGLVPTYRGRGLGQAMLHEALIRVFGSGLARAELTVTAENYSAVGLYGKMGFQVSERFSVFIWSKRQSAS